MNDKRFEKLKQSLKDEQKIVIEASSGLNEAEIQRMKDEAAANADSDKAAKERVDKINSADSLIFQTEKQMEEFGDKLTDDKKAPILEALETLKVAHQSEDVDALEGAMETLNSAFQAVSQEMYAQSQEGSGNAGAEGASGAADEEVTDVDFEEVDEVEEVEKEK